MTSQERGNELHRQWCEARERGLPPSERLPEEKPRVVRVGDHSPELSQRSVA